MEKSRKRTIALLGGLAGGHAALLCLLLILRSASSAFAESFTRSVSRYLVQAAGAVTSLVPFSTFELFILAAVGGAIALIVILIRCLCKKRFFKALCLTLALCAGSLALGNAYSLTAGFAYYRAPAPLPVTQNKYDNEGAIDAAQFFLNDFNALAERLPRDERGNVLSPYDMKALSKKLDEEFKKLDEDYYFGYTPRGKKAVNSWFMTAVEITGITFLPLGEAVVNGQIVPSRLPQTLAHELAHAKGVMREGEANFVSYYVLVSSDDDYLRYCGYFAAFGYALGAVDADRSTSHNYNALRDQLSPLITAEKKNESEFWSSSGALNRFMGKIGNFFNDLYLKLSGAKDGTGSYGGMTGDGGIYGPGENNPDTGETIYDIEYSSVQKMFFGLYEKRTAG